MKPIDDRPSLYPSPDPYPAADDEPVGYPAPPVYLPVVLDGEGKSYPMKSSFIMSAEQIFDYLVKRGHVKKRIFHGKPLEIVAPPPGYSLVVVGSNLHWTHISRISYADGTAAWYRIHGEPDARGVARRRHINEKATRMGILADGEAYP